MTEKELRKLSRYQLLELLIIQTERANDLEQKLQEALEKLESRDQQIDTLGSITEAALHLSNVFEAAQNAADLYVNAAKERSEALEAEAARNAQSILEEANRKAGQLPKESETKREEKSETLWTRKTGNKTSRIWPFSKKS